MNAPGPNDKHVTLRLPALLYAHIVGEKCERPSRGARGSGMSEFIREAIADKIANKEAGTGDRPPNRGRGNGDAKVYETGSVAVATLQA